MSAYIAELNAAVARDRARRDEEAQVAKQAAQERFTPLEDRLAKLLATIRIEAQREGLSLSSLRLAPTLVVGISIEAQRAELRHSGARRTGA
jgi:hypothetical protein